MNTTDCAGSRETALWTVCEQERIPRTLCPKSTFCTESHRDLPIPVAGLGRAARHRTKFPKADPSLLERAGPLRDSGRVAVHTVAFMRVYHIEAITLRSHHLPRCLGAGLSPVLPRFAGKPVLATRPHTATGAFGRFSRHGCEADCTVAQPAPHSRSEYGSRGIGVNC